QIHGPEGVEVGGVLDLSLRIPRRLVEVDDRGVERMGGIERTVIAAHDLLIGAGRSERLAGREWLALADLDARDARFGSGRYRRGQKGEGDGFHRCPPVVVFYG